MSSRLEKREVVVLSTAHLPERLGRALDKPGTPGWEGFMIFQPTNDKAWPGFFLWVPNAVEDIEDVLVKDGVDLDVLDVLEIMRWARDCGADYILFDADGPVMHDELRVFEW